VIRRPEGPGRLSPGLNGAKRSGIWFQPSRWDGAIFLISPGTSCLATFELSLRDKAIAKISKMSKLQGPSGGIQSAKDIRKRRMNACVRAFLLPLMLATYTLLALRAALAAAPTSDRSITTIEKPTPAPSAYVFPTPVPVVTNQAEYDRLPIGASYWLHGRLQRKMNGQDLNLSASATPEPEAATTASPVYPTPSLSASPRSSNAFGFGTGVLIFLTAISLGTAMVMAIYRHGKTLSGARKPDSGKVDPASQRERDLPPRRIPLPRAVPVTSMRQAYEILGLPPGRISIEKVTKAYRELQSQYHPDRVAHLGPEFQELAAMKALQFNLAMQFIKNNAR
jgi:hypothetical protein